MLSTYSNYLSILLSLMVITCSPVCAQQFNIQHVEPMSWWQNMKNPELQLMVHGKDIATLTVRVPSPSIKVIKTHQSDNPNYLFVDLALSKSIEAGDYDIEFYSNNKKVISHRYNIASRNKHSAATTSFTPKDVIYLITPDRFANGDVSNDANPTLKEGLARNKKGGRHGGDIQGIINNLTYIKDMGFTQVWTNPMIENDQRDHSYHGYSATDFYQIDPRFGTNALYRQLSDKAQLAGIGLIKDVVLNHIGDGHWWMRDLPTNDWLNYQETYNQKDTFVGTHHKRESLHDPHATKSDQDLFSNGWFVPTMPDLNQRNPFVSNYLIQNTLWWIEFANLSGIRVDTYSYSDRDFLTNWTKRITTEYPNINIVGEEWTTNPAHVAYWQRGKNNYDNYVSYLPSVMDFPLQEAIVNALKNKENWNTGLNQLYQTIANDFQYADPYNLVTFTDNHDMSRLYTQLDSNLKQFKMAMTILLTTRGIPQVFYGTEIAMANPDTDDHGIIRSDFPGGWPTDKINGFTQTALTETQLNIQQFTKSLLNFRKNNRAIHQGKLTHYAPLNGIYVYFRTLDNDNDVMVVINKNEHSVSLNTASYQEVLNGYITLTNIASNKQKTLKQPIEVSGHSATIFTLSK